MDGLNRHTENGRIRPELKPESGTTSLNIKVAHGLNQHEVAVPSNSTFGDLKSVIVQKTGLKPEMQKLLFRGKEKDDDEFLQTAGVKDNCKVLLMEDTTSRERGPEENEETSVISQGVAAVAQVREVVDKLSDQAAALQTVVDSGTKIDNKDIIYLTEMLMRELLNLDSIVVEGEGRVQRKMEVRRVQSLVETMDILKSRNNSNGNNNVAVTTQWETFETGSGRLSTMSSTPTPSPTPILTSTPTPGSIPPSSPIPASIPPSSPIPASIPPSSPTPAPTPSSATVPSSTPNPVPSLTPTPPSSATVPSSTLNPVPSLTPTPAPVPSSTPTPVPFTIPISTQVTSSAASFMPSSTKVTQEWEYFD